MCTYSYRLIKNNLHSQRDIKNLNPAPEVLCFLDERQQQMMMFSLLQCNTSPDLPLCATAQLPGFPKQVFF